MQTMRTFDRFDRPFTRGHGAGGHAVLVVSADRRLRAALAGACEQYAIPVRTAGSIAEVEQWPVGQTVITDSAHLTPLWMEVGAARVIAVVDNPGDGAAALLCGATDWLWRRRFGPVHLLGVLGASPHADR